MVGPLGSATREQHHKGPCWQLCLCGVRLQQIEGEWWSEAGPGWAVGEKQDARSSSWAAGALGFLLHLEYGYDYIQGALKPLGEGNHSYAQISKGKTEAEGQALV